MLTAWTTVFDEDEFPIVSSGQGVSFRKLPVLTSTRLNFSNPESLREALRDDLVIISLSGHDPIVTIRGLIEMAGEKQWRQRKAKLVLRTQDSHHQLDREMAIIDEIDTLAIAHSNYLHYFPTGKALYVPCSLHQTRSLATEWLKLTSPSKNLDVIFPFQLYRGEPRNALAYLVHKKLKEMGISAQFGFFRYYRNRESPPALWEELARARIILNLPLRNDFNIRNFEASLFPAWHVTTRLPDHDLVRMDWSNSHFVEANAMHITSTIERLLRSREDNTPREWPSETVLEHHTASDRIYQITDTLLGTNLQDQPKFFGGTTAINKKTAVIVVYDTRLLLENSPTLISKVPRNSLFRPRFALRLSASLAMLRSLPRKLVKKITKT